MKIIYKTLFFVLFLLSNLSHAQDWIKEYPGIPLETGLVWDWVTLPSSGSPGNRGAVDSMKLAGIDIVRLSPSSPGRMDTITNWLGSGFRVLPFASTDQAGNIYNWMQHYTDAKYSIWEAEGTSLGNDDAGLKQKDPSKTEIYTSPSGTTFIRRLGNVANSIDQITEGPYYDQDVHYYASQDNVPSTIKYNAKFYLMLQNNNPPITYNPEDTICILQVTYSGCTSLNILDTTITIKDTVLKRIDFDNLDVVDTVSFNYNLAGTIPLSLPSYNPGMQASFKDVKSGPGPRDGRSYIEFKVIWVGKPNSQGKPSYLLSFDKIILSDDRGRFLKDSNTTALDDIESQDYQLSSYYDDIAGWIGIDEPVSIDIFEPIRMVKEKLESYTNNKRPLRIPFMGSWSGYWDQANNHFGAQGKSKWKVFNLRVGSTPIVQNFYLYEYPYLSNASPCNCISYRDRNIRVLAEMNYKQAYQLDPNFGASIQCGECRNTQATQRNVKRHEVLYSANLALMYGAKFIELWNYFAQAPINSVTNLSTHGIVDWDTDINHTIYTDKYFMLRDTLNPRLEGLFGQKIKHLTPNFDLDSLGIVVTSSNENVNYIKNITLISAPKDSTPIFDLGFFYDPASPDPLGYEDRYFMLLKRYYPQSLSLQNFNVSFNNMSPFTNWQISDFIDTTYYTITPNSNGEFVSDFFQLFNGDAIFYRLAPVVKYGGKLVYNETVADGTTLYEDMTIENGATLTVNGTYTANANITVKTGGKIIAGTNGKIIFDAYKKLIVDGTTEIKGSSFINKLTLEFASSEKGIDVLPASSLTLRYCNITGAYYGIVTRTGTPSYLNITNCNIGFGSTGIVLNGNFYIGGPSPTSIISNCNFTTWGTGISVSNNSSVIISQNNFTSCGISILDVPAAYIQSNSIYSGSNESYSGIFFNNSGGYIRSNTIKNRVNGIHLANSSPDVGGNIIQDNYRHGLYTGSGSIPNLVGHIQINPPLYFPLSGYNTIRNNGNNTQSGTENDGSEIYLSGTNIALRDGCNEISDDRQSAPNMSTLLLINGSLAPGGGRQLDARNNYWGTTTPTNSRFGLLSVLFTPYYGGPCPLPDGSGGSEEVLVFKTSSGEVVDTIYAAEGVPENFTTLEASYSEADNYFAKGSVDLAKPLYEQIVNANYTTEEKLPAYNKLYTIANLTGADEAYFNNLQSTFDDIANAETDTLLKKIYNQNAIKCDVSKEEYLTAISKFDNIIQQNPNSEEAIYAEIDIITTALNLDTTNSQLGKMGSGKYLVKGTSDYLSRLNDILQSKFGINSEEKEQIIPKEYSLHQNYPNPFNPTTTIKFDIPNDGLVQLEIFDILGRRITTLVEEYKPAGSYEQVFNASALASGVYVYKLQAGDFISSKKMILLK